MEIINYINIASKNLKISRFATLIALILLVGACASKGSKEDSSSVGTAQSGTGTEASKQLPGDPDSGKMQSTIEQTDSKPAKDDKIKLQEVAAVVEPLRVVESCKKEPYINYEKQARASIAKGWEATKAEKYGVGFRNAEEYKKWSNTHNSIFKTVSSACENLSKCANKHKNDRHLKCASQAKRYANWQQSVEDFVKNIKVVEIGQPPKLCSLKPSLDDPSKCYDMVANNIDMVCKSEQCQEASQCWRGIAFLDSAIRQSEQSCGFVHQKLENCTAYKEATSRRKNEFELCRKSHEALKVEIQPAL